MQSSTGENGFALDGESSVPCVLTSLAENTHRSYQTRRIAGLRKGTISFVMSVRPSVHMSQLRSYYAGSHGSSFYICVSVHHKSIIYRVFHDFRV